MLGLTIDHKKYLLVNLYGPNEDHPQFYNDIGEKIGTVQQNTTLLWVITSIWLL